MDREEAIEIVIAAARHHAQTIADDADRTPEEKGTVSRRMLALMATKF
jgi:hypothetical protein